MSQPPKELQAYGRLFALKLTREYQRRQARHPETGQPAIVVTDRQYESLHAFLWDNALVKGEWPPRHGNCLTWLGLPVFKRSAWKALGLGSQASRPPAKRPGAGTR